MKHMRLDIAFREGFALPTILISSVIMLTILTSAVTAVSSLSTSIEAQYYNQLSREAGESGMARALDCLKQSPTGTPQWSEVAPLRPNTECNGAVISGKSEYLTTIGNAKTTFRIGLPPGGWTSASRLSASGNVHLVRSSDANTVWRAYTQTVTQDSRYRSAPSIAGGAGYADNGHLAAVVTTDEKLYAFGANTLNQINDTTPVSPENVIFPANVPLPAGVTSISSVKTSGQGASIICILANTGQVYCRGAAGASENGLMPTAVGWKQFTLPAGVTATSFSIDGYGSDALCVLGSNSQAYCAGENYYGSLGNGVTTYGIYKINDPINGTTTGPQRFAVPAGINLTKIYAGPVITCGIATTGDMYCAGLNSNGQITGSSTNGTGNGVYSTPIKYNLPGAAGARKVKDVIISYHGGGSSVVHALATDGTIWSSGSYANGDLGHDTTAGSTGASQTPVPFTTAQAEYAAGSILWNANANKCLDNNGNLSANGNKIQIWDCAPYANHGATTWYYGTNQQLANYGTGKCLDVPNNNRADGQVLQLYDCNDSAAQKFELVDGIGGAFVRLVGSTKCLDIPGGATGNGTAVQLYECNWSAAQRFTRWGGIKGWQDMIVGVNHFCGLRDDLWSGMWCSGKNDHGQLMNWANNTGNSFLGSCQSTPAISGSTYNYLNVNIGYYNASSQYVADSVDISKLDDEWRQQFKSTMVIGKTGRVYGAGRDEYGKFGDNGVSALNDYQNCTTSVFGLPSGVTAMGLSARDEYTAYVLGSDGRVYAAGRNNNGQIGDGTTINRISPVEVKMPRQQTTY